MNLVSVLLVLVGSTLLLLLGGLWLLGLLFPPVHLEDLPEQREVSHRGDIL
ncbi:hypothetical protein [Anthocerotibacter panamensis]|uniref:hypothetical protein n=1 Tax=Anthocerotibacter panamensis TaxID=2857077 RepID=UPI001C4033CA|nr:hypothetical protein [Anthocerotibacter panamensis]